MKANFKNFTVKSTFKGDKSASWMPENYNNHMIKVINNESKKSCTFEFWNSLRDGEIKDEYSILNAFYCFVSDSISGEYDFEKFCQEFGYNGYIENDYGRFVKNKQVEKIWKACKKSLSKLERIYDGDIYELVNALSKDYA